MNEKTKLTYQGVISIFTAIGTAVALVLLSLGYISDAGAPGNEATARGVTNFDSLTLSQDLIVGDDTTLTDDVTIGGDLTVTGSTSGGAQTFTGLTVNGNATITGTLDQQGNVSDSGGAFTVADNAVVDGAADAIQFTVQGFTTQTNSLLLLEQSDGTDVATVSNAGLLTLAGGLTSSDGDNVVADDLRITAQTSITVTNGNPFTPTGTYQPITAAAEVTPTIATGGATAGDLLIVVNTSAQTINLADSGNQALSAAAALGQSDTLVLLFDGTNWVELDRSDN